jgi:pentatricopeptide repeat protein
MLAFEELLHENNTFKDPSKAMEMIEEMSKDKIPIAEFQQDIDESFAHIKQHALARVKAIYVANTAELNIMLVGFALRDELEKAISIFELMTKNYNIQPDATTKYLLAKCYMQRRLSTKALQLLADIFESDTTQQVELFNVRNRRKETIGAYLNRMAQEFIKSGLHVSAEYMIYQSMPDNGYTPDTTSMNQYMDSLIRRGKAREAVKLYTQVFQDDSNTPFHFKPDANTIAIAMNAYSIDNNIESAEKLFKQVERNGLEGIQLQPTMFSVMISAYERMGHVQGMRQWVEKLKSFEQTYNRLTIKD